MTATELIEIPVSEITEPLPGEFTPTSWVAPDDITYEQWLQVGGGLSIAHKAIHWWMGDWVLTGEGNKVWGEKYTQAIDETHWSLQTLKNDAWTADKIPRNHRREDLSWTHHYYVTPFDLDVIDAMLDRAAQRQWSTRKLYKITRRWRRIYQPTPGEVGASRSKKDDTTSFLPLPPTLDATPEDEGRTMWTAEQPDMTFINWRQVAKSEWRRKRFFERRCEELMGENQRLRQENAELLDEITQQAIVQSPVRALNWGD
jgi:hypothetical protein